MKCVFLTVAYNAEKTIARAMNSVLNQTYKDWIYYVVDNGSTDATNDIIKRYARKNPKIRPYHKEKNDIWTIAEFMNIVLKQGNAECFCVLDADDEYEIDFLQTGISYMQNVKTDMVILGTRMIDAQRSICVEKRVIPKTIYLNDKESFDENFPYVHWYLRQVWGKLWKISIMKKCNIAPISDISYGADTAWVMQYLLYASQVVIVNKIGYKYYISPTSDSYNYSEKRVFSDQYLFRYTCEVLQKKCGRISDKNREFLFDVYYYALNDSLNVIRHAHIDNFHKIKALYDLVNNECTIQLIESKGNNKNLFLTVAEELCDTYVYESQETYDMAVQTLANLGAFPKILRNYTKGAVFNLLLGIRNYLQSGTEIIDSVIVEFISVGRYINRLSIKELDSISDIVISILDNDYEETLKKILSVFERGKDISELSIESILECGLDIAALLDDKDSFICLKKIQIQALIQMNRKERALKELEDWDKIVPDDMEFENFRTVLES